MKVMKLGSMNLERKIEHNIKASINRSLIYYDRFIEYLKNQKPELVEDFLGKIKHILQSKLTNQINKIKSYNYDSIKDQLIELSKDSELINIISKLHLTLLEIDINYNWETEVKELLHLNVDKANYIPRFYIAKLLTEMLGREVGIQFFKNFIDYYVINYVNRPHIETMKEVYEMDVKNGQTSNSSAYLAALMHNGLYAGRVDSCMGHEALKELNDSILAELVTCYGDYEMVKKLNPNFILTRSCTLHTGPYCDGLYHDTRICKKIEHFPREFYDNLDKEK